MEPPDIPGRFTLSAFVAFVSLVAVAWMRR
jgi:hypothetical protein